MEVEQVSEQKVESQPSATTAPPSKKPEPGLHPAKKTQERASADPEGKAKARPRYTDKARKNARNKKDKAGVGNGAAPGQGEAGAQVEETRVKEQEEQEHTQPEEEEEEQEEEQGGGEEESWDTLFNDEGDCLEPHLEELAEKEGRKKRALQEARLDRGGGEDDDYDEELELRDDELAHIVEVYDFPTEFKTEDLIKLFQPYLERGFDIQWVDDTHAVGLFSSPIAAREALRSKHPLMKLRPLSKSSASVRAKARSCSDYLLPAKERPQTTASMARRLVVGALGVKSGLSQEQRDADARKLQQAREQKRLAAQQKEDAWEGK